MDALSIAFEKSLAARTAVALAIGGLGGWIFVIIGAPLPWMLGAMLATILAALLRISIYAPQRLRSPMIAVVGAMLGAGVTPEVVQKVGDWVVPLAGLLLLLLVTSVASTAYFRWVGRFDLRTSFVCALPGGLLELVLFGESIGADVHKVALVHTIRIFLIVFGVPFIVYALSPEVTMVVVADAGYDEAPLHAALWMFFSIGCGIILARICYLPAGQLLGPMIISGVVHAAGLSSFVVPVELVSVAQLVLGVSIGAGFVGITLVELGRVFITTIGSTAVQLSLAGAFAWLFAAISLVSPIALFLAYTPGGLPEMGLIALALGIETTFVIAHHVLRVVVLALGAPVAQKFIPGLATSDRH